VTASDSTPEETTSPNPAASSMPPPTLESLVTVLATQALIAMGQIPDPQSGQPVVELDQASHFVELLGMLETKTAGNVTPEEAQLLEDVLHQLRMMYVAAKK